MAAKKATDLDRLQGTWRVTALETDGNEMAAAAFEDATITVRGSEFSSRGMGDDYSGTIELIADKKLKAFDLVFTAGPPAGTRNRGIYALESDTWTICLATRGDARPRRFATKPDSGLALETLVRGTPPRHRTPSAVATQGQQILREPALEERKRRRAQDDTVASEIEGEFLMVSAVFDGKPLAPDMVKWCKRLTHGNVTRILAGPQTMLDAEFTLDPSKTPRQIDYVNRSGKNKGKKQAGIYEVSEGLLEICVGPPSGPRPTDFSSTKGDGRSYTVWRR